VAHATMLSAANNAEHLANQRVKGIPDDGYLRCQTSMNPFPKITANELEHNFGHGERFLARRSPPSTSFAYVVEPPWQAARQAATKRHPLHRAMSAAPEVALGR
jgi:hypothetical protein